MAELKNKDGNGTPEILNKPQSFSKTDDLSCREEEARRKTNRFTFTALTLCAVILLTFFLGFFTRGWVNSDVGRKSNEITDLIDGASYYVDKLTSDEIAEMFVKKLNAQGDKYAHYYNPAAYKKMLEESAGNYTGVGVQLTANGEVYRVYNNSSAYVGGVKKGDILIGGVFKGETDPVFFADRTEEKKTADPDATLSATINEFFSGFGAGEEINITVRRGDAEFSVILKKEDYVVSYVEYYDNGGALYFATDEIDGQFRDFYTEDLSMAELPDDTAYIKLYEFEGGAAGQFAKAMDFMQEREKEKLILDLRDNGGGSISVLLEIASHLVNDKGSNFIKILDVQEKTAKTHFSTSQNAFHENLKEISVIANYGTASASECLIGALMDYGNPSVYKGAKFSADYLVLTEYVDARNDYTTFGKGIMQTTYELKSGGAFTITTAEIFWPISGTCVHNVGVTTALSDNKVSDEDAIARAVAVLHSA